MTDKQLLRRLKAMENDFRKAKTQFLIAQDYYGWQTRGKALDQAWDHVYRAADRLETLLYELEPDE